MALASAEKYPNAYILCTGGGTNPSNPHVTEAGQMASWLKKQGIASERIIVEELAFSTEDNVLNSYRILSRDYPQVKSITLVSSDYHLRRCHLLFTAGILLMDMPYTIVGDAAFDAGHEGTHEGYWEEMKNLGKMAGVYPEYFQKPELCRLTGLSLQVRYEYQAGDALNLTVTAEYDNGFTRDVTDLAQITGFDTTIPGQQTLMIQYEENGVLQECSFSLEVILPPTTVPATLPPVTDPPITQEPVELPQADAPSHGNLLKSFLLIFGSALLIPLGFLLRSVLRRGKYAQGRRK